MFFRLSLISKKLWLTFSAQWETSVTLSENEALETHWPSKTESPKIASVFAPLLALQCSFLFLTFLLCAILCISILINPITSSSKVEPSSNPELNANLAPEKQIK